MGILLKVGVKMIYGVLWTLMFLLGLGLLPFIPRFMFSWFMVNVLGGLCHVSGTVEGTKTYNKFKKEQSKGVILFTHPTFYDAVVLHHISNDCLRGVIKSQYVTGPLKLLVWKLQMVVVESYKAQLSSRLTDWISHRKCGEDLICLAPAGTTLCVNANQVDIPVFRKGAFWSLPPILPFVMYYSHIEVWDKQSVLQIIFERMTGPYITYHAMAMEPIFPQENEEVDGYIKRVQIYMQEGVLKCRDKLEKDLKFKYSILDQMYS